MGRELEFMITSETESQSSKNFARVAFVLMVVLLAYGTLSLMGVVR
jgi:hypothetical protein